MSVHDRDRRWVARLIAEERVAAAVLLVAGAIGIVGAQMLGATSTGMLLHPHIAGRILDLPWFAADGLLVTFFFVAGLELRHEFTEGSLRSVRAAMVPSVAAAFGMLMPALLFLLLAPGNARAAWGVPMATDLPLALALVAVAGRGLPLRFRAFILSLAIVDDALSILVIAVVFGGQISLPWLVVTALLVVAYAKTQQRSNALAAVVAIGAWLAMLHTGIHATVLGVALGLITGRQTDVLRNGWQPFVGLIAVPIFVLTSLALPLSTSDIDPRLITGITLARIVGKPVGILLGAMLAVRLFRPHDRLPARAYAVAGSVAGLGFSVPMLFADLGLQSPLVESVKIAIVAALAGCGAVAAVALTYLRRSALAR